MLPATAEGYLEALLDSYILYKADRYDIKGKKMLKILNKYYIADIRNKTIILNLF
jgi:hypothetical protein